MTGLRRDQWATRSNIRKIEIDHDHGGIVKLAPLADWTEDEVWDYIRANDVPYNELYDKGYKSIGCAPCTRAVADGARTRAPADGGGKPARRKNAGCIARSRPAASSMNWRRCSAAMAPRPTAPATAPAIRTVRRSGGRDARPTD